MEESVIQESTVRCKSRRLVIAAEGLSCRQTREWLARGDTRIVPFYAFMTSTGLHACVIASLFLCAPKIHPQEAMAQVYSVEILPGIPDAWTQADLPESLDAEPEKAPAPAEDPVPVQEEILNEPSPVVVQAEPPPENKKEQAVEKAADYGGDPSIASDLVVGESNYWQAVRSAIAGQVRYPSFAQRQRREGYVLVELSIDAQGQLRSVVPLESSSSIFLRSATEAIQRAAPFPPPTNCASDVITAVLPIHFRVNQNKENDDES